MAIRVNSRDIELLGLIAEHRVLTISQAAALGQRNIRSLRRRLRVLMEVGLVQVNPAPLGKKRGRPEGLVSLSDGGVVHLKDAGILDRDTPHDQILAVKLPFRHQLLVNDFRVTLAEMTQVVPAVEVRFLAPTSPFVSRVEGDRSSLCERFENPDLSGDWIDFTPDGVFMLTHREEDRPLLFFLEADRGTEILASPKRTRGDFRRKILNYHAAYRLRRYRRYEQVWSRRFQGFRLLILAHSEARMAGLCRLVRDMPPSDYIHATERGRMMTAGGWAKIWVKGGRTDGPRHSILGARLPKPAPTPSRPASSTPFPN